MSPHTALPDGVYCLSVTVDGSHNDFLLSSDWSRPWETVAQTTVTASEGEQQLGINFGWDYQFLP